jgi:deoxyribonuclease-4
LDIENSKTENSRRVGAHVSVAGGITNAIENIKKIDGNCIQFFAGSPRTWARKIYSTQQVTEFNSKVDQEHLRPVFIHALYLVNLASLDPNIFQKSTDSLLTDLQNADLIKAEGVVIHIGSHLGRGFDSCKTQVVQVVNQLLNSTVSTNIIFENDAGQNGKIGSLEELSELVSEIQSDRIKICLDTAHLFASGYDLRDLANVDLLVDKLSRLKLLPRLVCLHVNDSKSALGSQRDVHANLGEGEIGITGLSNVVNHPSLKHLPMILEVPGINHQGPDLENIQIAKDFIHKS